MNFKFFRYQLFIFCIESWTTMVTILNNEQKQMDNNSNLSSSGNVWELFCFLIMKTPADLAPVYLFLITTCLLIPLTFGSESLHWIQPSMPVLKLYYKLAWLSLSYSIYSVNTLTDERIYLCSVYITSCLMAEVFRLHSLSISQKFIGITVMSET